MHRDKSGAGVRVVISQHFTVVTQEPTLRADFDAHIAKADACVQTRALHGIWAPAPS